MPIVEITNRSVNVCCAACEKCTAVDFDQLVLVELEASTASGILPLPHCACGAAEFLVHSPAREPPHYAPGSHAHLHRLVVDALVDAIVARKTEGSDLSLGDAVRAKLGSDIIAQWFKDGLKVVDQRTREPTPTNEGEAP
jgi:hypothetical protein